MEYSSADSTSRAARLFFKPSGVGYRCCCVVRNKFISTAPWADRWERCQVLNTRESREALCWMTAVEATVIGDSFPLLNSPNNMSGPRISLSYAKTIFFPILPRSAHTLCPLVPHHRYNVGGSYAGILRPHSIRAVKGCRSEPLSGPGCRLDCISESLRLRREQKQSYINED